MRSLQGSTLFQIHHISINSARNSRMHKESYENFNKLEELSFFGVKN